VDKAGSLDYTILRTSRVPAGGTAGKGGSSVIARKTRITVGVVIGAAIVAIAVAAYLRYGEGRGGGHPRGLAPELAGRVVVLSCDAFDWRIYREVSRRRPMPNIERLLTEGTTGDLISIEPLVSPMIWTTMATGVEPPVHGIVDFLMKDAATGEDVPITSAMRRVPALWNMLTASGKSSGFVGWLGTFPAETVKGFMVSDRISYHMFDPRWQKGAVGSPGAVTTGDAGSLETAGLTYPPNLIDELRPLVVDSDSVTYQTVRAFIEIEPGELVQGAKVFHPLDLPRNLRLALASNLTYEGIAAYTYGKFEPQLFSVYLDLIDNVCHLFIKYMEPHTADVSDQDAARYGRAVDEAYARTDSLLGEWLKRIDDRTTLILLSDHGFKSGDLRPDVPSVIGAVQATRWHRMAGAIALYGRHVRKGGTLTGASVLDVTPTVLRLVGLPRAKDMPGKVLEEALDPEWLAAAAGLGEIETYGARKETAPSPRRKEEEEAILKRLKALGYVGTGPTDLMKLAHSHYVKREFDKAIEIWNEILKQEPDNPEVVVGMGNALIEKGDLEKSYLYLQGVLKRNPDFLPAKNLLALYHINVGHLDQAVELSTEVISRDPRNAEAYFNLSIALDQRGSYDQALAALEKSVALRGDYELARINLGNAYLRRGRLNDAGAQLDKALEINPGNQVAWFAMGKLKMSTGKPEEAIAAFREALRREPGFNTARVSLAVALASSGKLAEARQELERGLAYDSELGIIHTNIGVIDRQLGDKGSAEKHFKQAIEIDSRYLPARFDLADLYLSGGDKRRAAAELEAILKIDPQNRDARSLLATLK
jgi:tetratricopeptide (TPR) repeat protein